MGATMEFMQELVNGGVIVMFAYFILKEVFGFFKNQSTQDSTIQAGLFGLINRLMGSIDKLNTSMEMFQENILKLLQSHDSRITSVEQVTDASRMRIETMERAILEIKELTKKMVDQ
jgi:hypothetical protein